MKYLSLLVCLLVTTLSVAVNAEDAPDVGSVAANVLEHARDYCRSLDDGEFYAQEGAVTQLDVTGDGVANQLVDASQFACSTAVTPYCGTGGCPLTVIVNDEPFEFQAMRWKVINWDQQPVLLLHVPSSACDSQNWQPCIKALTWSEGRFRGVVPRP